MKIRSFFVTIIALAVLAVSIPASADEGPTGRLKEGIDKILVILQKPGWDNAKKRPELTKEISGMVDNYFDFKELTMRSVGRPWLKMDAKTQGELVDAFRQLLELTYIQKVKDYGGENKINYTKQLVQGKRAMVLTEVVSKDKTINVNYKLVNKDGKWMVYDVIAEGVSLVKNYRSQFAEILHDNNVAELLKRIKEKVADLEKAADKE